LTAYKSQLLLGYAGAIGFFAIAFLVSLGYPIDHFITYSNGILLFVAGTHWDKNASHKSLIPLVSALVASLVIVVTMVCAITEVLIVSSVCYLAFLGLDTRLIGLGKVDKAYIGFRTTATVSALLTSVFVLITVGN
jgi:hypothetical protein